MQRAVEHDPQVLVQGYILLVQGNTPGKALSSGVGYPLDTLLRVQQTITAETC